MIELRTYNKQKTVKKYFNFVLNYLEKYYSVLLMRKGASR